MITADSTSPATLVKLNRSKLFKFFNLARQAARAGKLEAGRVNRALGILQSRAGQLRLERYAATVGGCVCEDKRRGHTCKHQIARMIEQRAGGLLEHIAQVTQ